ncbi:MAG: DsbA family protein [Rhodospirillales bacterium]|nr:DsbA family protein [Rhodospirillales bacterium]
MTLFLRFLFAAIIIVAGLVGYKAWNVHASIKNMQQAELGQVLGTPDASRVIVEFADYRCNYCRMLNTVVRELVEQNPDIRVVIAHLPVLGEKSAYEARLALAAAKQGKFSEIHDLLMQRETPVAEAEVEGLAEQLGLDYERLKSEMESDEVTQALLANIDAAEALDIFSTPTFLIGKTIYNPAGTNMPTAEDIKKVLDQLGK